MIPLVTADSMKELDRRATAEFGLPAVQLMEAAGHALAGHAVAERILVLCGGGNNGGDGYAAARHLLAAGRSVTVVSASDPSRLPEAATAHFKALQRAGVTPVPFAADLLRDADLVVDALVGVGMRGSLRSPLAEIVEAVNDAGVPVLAADVPSGLGAGGPCIRAARTVCLGATKYDCIVHPDLAGAVSCDPLGIPPAAWDGLTPDVALLESTDVVTWLPKRPLTGHKGTFGKVVVIAGSPEFAGAGLLAAHAAVRSGAGLVFLATRAPGLAGRIPEVIVRPYSPDLLPGADAVAIGPGLGQSDEARRTVTDVIGTWQGPIVIDADALNLSTLASLPEHAVITPHPGEAGRLLGSSAAEVERDRLAAVRRLGRIAVLKGFRTLVAAGRIWVNPTGNNGMGSGGTGDVLTGLIGGLLAQGVAPDRAAPAAVYIHGLAGDRAAARLGRRAMGAGDLIEALPEAFRALLGADA
jgi:hydroxyethylthiazole kinase-like uncharacterized protein yjeF